MLEHVQRNAYLDHETAVLEIEQRFGEPFVYLNDQGNQAIAAEVLREFRRISKETVVWERGERVWRERRDHDLPGRRQAD